VGRERSKTKGFIKTKSLKGGVWVCSLMKHNKKGKKCAVFCFAGKRKLLYLYLRCDYMGIFL
jgi:hypothetical protein